MQLKAKKGSDSGDSDEDEEVAAAVAQQREKEANDKKKLNLVTDTELLARFYGDGDELDHNDKFLRNYILNEGWKEK